MTTLSLPAGSSWRDYLALTKPGIVLGNLVSVSGGLAVASHAAVLPASWPFILLGSALVMAAGCVFNNVIDRDIDRLMARTRRRVLARDGLSPAAALLWGSLLLLAGFTLLLHHAPTLSVLMALTGFGIYVGPYSLYLKRHSSLGLWIGSVAGAMPPLIGYCAVHPHFDGGAWSLLALFCLWQIPHAQAIGILHRDDYRRAALPLPDPAPRRLAFPILAFGAASLLPYATGLTGAVYAWVMLALSAGWLVLLWRQRQGPLDRQGARCQFHYSLLAIMTVNALLLF